MIVASFFFLEISPSVRRMAIKSIGPAAGQRIIAWLLLMAAISSVSFVSAQEGEALRALAIIAAGGVDRACLRPI